MSQLPPFPPLVQEDLIDGAVIVGASAMHERLMAGLNAVLKAAGCTFDDVVDARPPSAGYDHQPTSAPGTATPACGSYA